MWRLVCFIAFGILTVAGFIGGGCHGNDRRHQGRPDILLLTLDTLRADHLSCYGYKSRTSPFLDSLARRGTLFEAAYTSSNVTKPSHATLLTGLYPARHGLTDNGKGILSPALKTVAEYLRENGYQTFAIVAAALLNHSTSGLGQGFSRFRNSPGAQVRAATVVDAALQHIENLGRAPFFAWLHFYDPHIPYAAPGWRPAAPAKQHTSVPIKQFRGHGPTSLKGAIPSSSAIGEIGDPKVYADAYDAEIRYLDAELERLIRGLESKRKGRPLAMVVIADHGEMLGEHGIYYNHASLYEEVIRIPLILVGPGIKAGNRVSSIVESVDVFATLLDLGGVLDAPSNDGQSLLDAGRTGDDRENASAFSYHNYGLVASLRKGEETFMLPLGSPQKVLVSPFHTHDRDALLRYIDAEAPAYFVRDPSRTPNEQENLYTVDRQRASELETQLHAWLKTQTPVATPLEGEIDETTLKQMRELGYF